MTIEIPLTQGKVALIDDEDWPLVAGHKWRAYKNGHSFYAASDVGGRRNKRTLQMHRLLLGAMPGQFVDHKDRNGLNNTRSNLRLCTKAQNAQNSRKYARGSSLYKGVRWRPERQKWFASIGTHPNVRWLGTFTDPVEAAKAYDAAAKQLFGEFARLNFG